MTFDNDFDISRPIDHTLIADLPGWHRNTKVQVKALLAKEHIEPDVGGYGGQHVKGSARAFLQSTEPTTRPDGDAITTAASTAAVKDDGRLAVLTGIKTGYNVLRVYAATSAGVSTGWSNLHVASVDKAFSVELTGDDNIEIENNKAILWRKHNEPATTISAIKVNTSNEVEILHALTVAGAVQVGGKITGVTDPTEDQDAATKKYVDDAIPSQFTPSSYAGEESVILPNGLTMKFGKDTTYTGDLPGGTAIVNVSFDTAFDTACLCVFCQVEDNSQCNIITTVHSLTASGFSYKLQETYGIAQDLQGVFWFAIGY